ncbi:hypothetical protein [Syntrophomonas palmitatica]|uniref:hypothetical protein n=1 Tax=Syntrophomonas palmitatica TaxID=402877 RepID=UPI000A9427D4|nr:hypothetical protein [Syntrophomonas palmitatica]
MRVYSEEPLNKLNRRLRLSSNIEDLEPEDAYEELWLPAGDDKENDIQNLLRQNRIRTY